jgi:hypothetical protein
MREQKQLPRQSAIVSKVLSGRFLLHVVPIIAVVIALAAVRRDSRWRPGVQS